MAIQSYKDLNAWKRSIEVVEILYFHTKTFPASEIYGLTSQIRRAAISISSNMLKDLAENLRKSMSSFCISHTDQYWK